MRLDGEKDQRHRNPFRHATNVKLKPKRTHSIQRRSLFDPPASKITNSPPGVVSVKSIWYALAGSCQNVATAIAGNPEKKIYGVGLHIYRAFKHIAERESRRKRFCFFQNVCKTFARKKRR